MVAEQEDHPSELVGRTQLFKSHIYAFLCSQGVKDYRLDLLALLVVVVVVVVVVLAFSLTTKLLLHSFTAAGLTAEEIWHERLKMNHGLVYNFDLWRLAITWQQ